MSTAEDLEKTLAAIDAELGIDAEADDDETRKPWAGVEVPRGYILNASGVAVDGDDPEILAYRPAWVSAVSRDGNRENWGRLVHWLDLDGHEHAEAIPAELFHAQGNELAQRLASRGLPIAPGREKKLVRYLTAFQPTARLVSATSTGWHGEAFVLPGNAINTKGDERLVFQTGADIGEAIHAAGNLDTWRELVADLPPIVRFLVCASLAAPLRFPLGVEAGGFHLCGATSKGKTTALQAASSVWGCAIDPGIAGGAAAYINRWNATSNALEGMAAGFNDLPLVVDEIGEGESKDFGRTVYRIMSGSGRSRARRDGSLARRRAWRILLLSAGELPVAEYIAEGGARARGGQLVRLLDLPVDTVFPDAETADRIKHGVAEHYGHAGPAFIEWAARRLDDLRERWLDFDNELIGPAPTSEAGRARKRFALVAFAGELGIEAGILPWHPGDATACAIEAFTLWRRQTRASDEGQRGIENVRAFIEANAARFETRDDHPPRDRAGWRRQGCWHFTSTAFREACCGANVRATKEALKKAGLLRFSHGLSAQLRVEGSKVKTVCVREEILGFSLSGGSTGSGGSDPYDTRHRRGPTAKSGMGPLGPVNDETPTDGPSGPTAKSGVGPQETLTAQGMDPVDPVDPLQSEEPEQDRAEIAGRMKL